MKRLFIFMLMLVSLAGAAFAGSLYVNDPTFEDGSNDYNGSAIIDADTLEGNQASDFVSLAYVQSKEASWSKDDVGGGGVSRRTLSRLLSGEKNLFDRYDTFVDYLKQWFAPRSEVEALRLRVDELEARLLGESLDDFQKAKATEEGSYGPYTCADGLCIKRIN